VRKFSVNLIHAKQRGTDEKDDPVETPSEKETNDDTPQAEKTTGKESNLKSTEDASLPGRQRSFRQRNAVARKANSEKEESEEKPSEPQPSIRAAPSPGRASNAIQSKGNDNGEFSNGNGNSGGNGLSAIHIPEEFSPVLALPITRRPLFPGFYKTVVIKDPEVIRAIKELARTQQPYVAAVLLKDEEADTDKVSSLDEIHQVGVFCQITNVYHSSGPGGAIIQGLNGSSTEEPQSLTAILYPHRRIRIKGLVSNAPTVVEEVEAKELDGVKQEKKKESVDKSPQSRLRGKFDVTLVTTEAVVDEPYKKNNQLIRAVTTEIVNVFKDIASLNPLFREQIAAFSISQASATIFDDPAKLADFAAAVSGGSDAFELQGVLESVAIEERLQKALYVLKKELVNAQLQSKISKEVESKIQKRQREYYLMEQLKGIKKELGLESDGKDKLMEKFKDRLAKLGNRVPPSVAQVVDEEMQKLATLDPASSEFNVTRNYLDWLTCLPWGVMSSETLDIHAAKDILDADHYGLKDVKERILEFIAVGKLKGSVEGKIICLSGPPGVGKTSIGKSIARALGREFYRFSVGGLWDVAEIKGHRRTCMYSLSSMCC
jgi:Lon-like ATP-dependent protease